MPTRTNIPPFDKTYVTTTARVRPSTIASRLYQQQPRQRLSKFTLESTLQTGLLICLLADHCRYKFLSEYTIRLLGYARVSIYPLD